jgi:hypothetical protein
MLSAQENKSTAPTPTTTGTGERYKTTINQEKKGELKPEDARQISVLGSRILTHVHNATRLLDQEKTDEAKTELEHAQTLAKVVREMLPVTVVSTTTTDAQGKEVYRYEDRVQDDQIPIVEGLINVQVVEPIVEAKKEQASLKGVQLADADLIHTAVLMNLDFVEGKIQQALAKLKEPEKAQTELLAASAIGVRFTTHKEDHPLVKIQAALRLAEQQVREGKHEGAKANLQLARVQLDAYRTLVGEAGAKGAGDLEKEIGSLQEKTREPGAADRIRAFWNRVTDWFTPESGKAQQTGEPKEENKAKGKGT